MAGFRNDVCFAQKGLRIGAPTITTNEQGSIQFDNAAAATAFRVANTSTVGASDSQINIVTTDTGGNPFLRTSIGTTKSYAMGQNSATNFWTIRTSDDGNATPSSGQKLLEFDEGIVGAYRALFPIAAMALGGSGISPGSAVDFNLLNSNTAAGSNARLNLQVSATSGGNALIVWTGPPNTWAQGVDKSDGNNLKILSPGNFTTGNTIIEATPAGEVTFPLTPAFLATSPAVSNVTGGGTVYSFGSGGGAGLTEIFDQGSDLSPGDGAGTAAQFVAPVTGRYLLGIAARIAGISASMTEGTITITTSNRPYSFMTMNYAAIRQSAGNFVDLSGCVAADMDALDTATFSCVLANDTDTADISATQTRIWGFLQC